MRKALGGIGVALLAGLAGTAGASAQAPRAPGHVVVVKMVEMAGQQFRFQPASITVQPGDTVRWVQESTAPHNVQFESKPKGARLGGAEMGGYLTSKGETYQLVIDGRFPIGSYGYLCTPHGPMGMKGTMTVAASAP
jgi:plastocyanin